jgi:hypothetical protein
MRLSELSLPIIVDTEVRGSAHKTCRDERAPRLRSGLTVRALCWNNRHVRQSLANRNEQLGWATEESRTGRHRVDPDAVHCVAYSP